MEEEKKEITFYEELKKIRISKDIKLSEISDNTKINIKYLEAIENGNFDSLPNIYIRLFIRTYSEYLNCDSSEILNKYEEHTNIKSKKIIKNIKKTKKNVENKDELAKAEKSNHIKSDILVNRQTSKKSFNDMKLNQNYFYENKKIFKIIATIVSLITIYMFVSYLSLEQKNRTKAIVEITEDTLELKGSINNILLTDNDFEEGKLISEKSSKLKFKLNKPYKFQIVTKEKTKIYISYDNDDGKRLEACNIIAPKDSLLKFENNNNIYFDFWNSDHVAISIDNNPISKYFDQKNALIRGSFSPGNKKLYLKSYSH